MLEKNQSDDHKEPDVTLSKHKVLNENLHLQEELEYWQDKLLQMKLKSVKEDYEFSLQKKVMEDIYNDELMKNKSLTDQINEITENINSLAKEDYKYHEELNNFRSETIAYEMKNDEMFRECKDKYNYLRGMENVDSLIKHILKFDPEVCKRFYAFCSEKVNAALMGPNQVFYQNPPGVQNSGPARNYPPVTYPVYYVPGNPRMQGMQGANVTKFGGASRREEDDDRSDNDNDK